MARTVSTSGAEMSGRIRLRPNACTDAGMHLPVPPGKTDALLSRAFRLPHAARLSAYGRQIHMACRIRRRNAGSGGGVHRANPATPRCRKKRPVRGRKPQDKPSPPSKSTSRRDRVWQDQAATPLCRFARNAMKCHSSTSAEPPRPMTSVSQPGMIRHMPNPAASSR